MLTVDQALETILSRIQKLEIEERLLIKALGQTAAENVNSDINVPDWDSSAMDGFAVRAEDILGANPQNPRILQIIDTVMAGSVSKHVIISGQAIRIMTGAPIPSGADCVVRFEDTNQDTFSKRIHNIHRIGILKEEPVGANIRSAGEMLRKGQLVISQGIDVSPVDVGILAALGRTRIKVTRRPTVAILSTGSELIAPGKLLSKPFIYSGSSYHLAAQVQHYGGVPRIIGIARDNKSSIINKIHQGLKADLLITTGGVSMGDRDLVKNALSEMGEIVFEQVRMSPGKSIAFALLHTANSKGETLIIPHFALPGNPAASLISFEVLVRPALLKMRGYTHLDPVMIEAIIEDNMHSNNYPRYVWVKVYEQNRKLYARLIKSDAKGILASIKEANGLAIIVAGNGIVKRGDKFKVILLHPLSTAG